MFINQNNESTIHTEQLKLHICENGEYSLFKLNYSGTVRFAICILSGSEAAFEVLDGRYEQANEIFELIVRQALCCEHLNDVLQDFRHERMII